MLPAMFRSILWSYDYASLDPDKHRRTIVTSAINYGDLKHWRWLIHQYGRRELRQILAALPASALRPRVARLTQLIFGIERFSHASRRTDA